MGDPRGIHQKYRVERTDGSSKPGGKHAECAYFVLDLEHDPFAIPALRAYAEACRERYPILAFDLDNICNMADRNGSFGPTTPNEMAGALMVRRAPIGDKHITGGKPLMFNQAMLELLEELRFGAAKVLQDAEVNSEAEELAHLLEELCRLLAWAAEGGE